VSSSPPYLACFCGGWHGIFPPGCPEAPPTISDTSTIRETMLQGRKDISMHVWDMGMGTPRQYPA
jgi:hypothetical protein